MRAVPSAWSCRVSDGFEGVDELVEVVVHVAMVRGEPEPTVGFCGGDEDAGLISLTAVDVEDR